jgi:hypothetical protein
MRRLGLSFLTVLFVVASAQMAVAKGEKKAKKGKAVKGAAPIAMAAAIGEFKGEFKWGMTPAQVMEKIFAKIEANYKDRREDAMKDPMRTDMLRNEIQADQDRIKKSIVKFDGAKSGWDVSIIDKEFLQNNGESMLVNKEPKQTRYFFFMNDSLYKMFVAFEKEVLEGKNFEEFGKLMQGKYGKALPVHVDKQIAPGMKEKVLDSYLWRSAQGDGLRLVDRSAFYDVYCLVIYDNATAEKQEAALKAKIAAEPKGSFVDSVVSQKPTDRDENDNVIDRITGKEVLKPGDRRGGQNIVVPSPTGK